MMQVHPYSLAGKRALVTGAGTGIGRQLALGLAEAGCEVSLIGRREQPLALVADEVRDLGGDASCYTCDVSSEEGLRALESTSATVDVLVNNAGVSDRQPWLDVKRDDWDAVIDLNLWGGFRLAQMTAPGMIKRKWGRIINVASLYAERAPDRERYPGVSSFDLPAYGASKAGALALTRHLAVILGSFGITVNAISPGMFRTERTEGVLTPAVEEALSSRTPMRRLGTGEDLRGAVAFLASDAASFITGIDLVIDGGYSLV